jgi:hypothetical protein
VAGVWETLFGSPPPPAHPASRGALLGMGGYQQMPDMKAGIEDQRHQIPESTSLSPEAAINAGILSKYPRGSHVYNADAWAWLQQHMPSELPTTPIAGSPAMPSGTMDGGASSEFVPSSLGSQRGPVAPSSLGPQRGPQIAGPLSQGMWDGQ